MKKDTLPRVVIEGVTPAVDCGRHPVKRVLGEELAVSVVIYKDGHDLIGARLLYRGPGEQTFREAPLEYDVDADIWRGSLAPDRVGRWQWCVEAWPAKFLTWQQYLKKRVEAGQDVAVELLEGAELLEARSALAAESARPQLLRAAKALADESKSVAERLPAALDAGLAALAEGPGGAADATRSQSYELTVDRRAAGFASWYEFFPRSTGKAKAHGTFRSAEAALPRIAELGFDVVYLPPVHPIGVTHRKGRNNSVVCEPGDVGSPWAIGGDAGGHDALHPGLGTFADFDHFVKRAGELGLEVALDYALQCSPDHPWVFEHPDWFFKLPDGSIRYAENPPKKYEDIYPINFWCADRENLWKACRDVLLFWVGHGVRQFRVDNPHTKPLAFWEWMIREVQDQHPDVLFFAEAFTRPNRMQGLAKLGFTMSYTYFTWKNDKADLTEFIGGMLASGALDYYRPNYFANTPDILHEYLQAGGRAAFRVRLTLAATLSPLYGIYSGYELCENVPVKPGSEEYLDSEKYEIKARDFGAPGNLDSEIRRLNQIRRSEPALQNFRQLEILPIDNDQLFAFRRWSGGDQLIIAVNLDPHGPQDGWLQLPLAAMGLSDDQSFEVEDLLTGERYPWQGPTNYVRLDPISKVAHVLKVHA